MLFKLWTATERKLAMAKYYLQRMRDTQNNPYAFDFECELESFLAHAGSITNLPRPRADEDKWFMEKEYGHKPGFKEWYEEKRLQLNSDEIMQFLRGERNIVVHFNKQIIHAVSTTKESFVDQLSVSSSFQAVVTNVDDGTENMVESLSEIAQPALPILVPEKWTGP